jgi:hypothetical protein
VNTQVHLIYLTRKHIDHLSAAEAHSSGSMSAGNLQKLLKQRAVQFHSEPRGNSDAAGCGMWQMQDRQSESPTDCPHPIRSNITVGNSEKAGIVGLSPPRIERHWFDGDAHGQVRLDFTTLSTTGAKAMRPWYQAPLDAELFGKR